MARDKMVASCANSDCSNMAPMQPALLLKIAAPMDARQRRCKLLPRSRAPYRGGLIGFAAAKLTDERWAKGFLVEPQAVDIWSCGGHRRRPSRA
jgi:hypothetical protein